MKKGEVIPFGTFQARQINRENDRLQGIATIRQDGLTMLRAAQAHYDRISEDSYASRIEARNRVNFLTRFSQKISRAAPGKTVDLRQEITDYGYDPEAAATDQSCGLEFVSEADRKETDYHVNISTVSGLIRRLETAGVQVAVGVIRKAPDEDFDFDD